MSHDDARVRDLGLNPTRRPRPVGNSKSVHPVSGTKQDAHPRKIKRPSYVVGPNGDVVTLADLPSPRTTRWVIRRKAEVVLAVRGGLLSFDEACRRYQLTAEEFLTWQKAIERHGLPGLRSTHLKEYRQGDKN
jgi:hypothetical protein